MQGKIKKIKGIFPVTVLSGVYVDGTNKTLKKMLDSGELRGPKGDRGETGAAGPAGPVGPTGAKGATGETGPQGPTGAKGADGKSAYDIWKAQSGNSGKTEQEFLQSLKGAKGDRGETGPQGPIGQTGPKGETGLAGAQGPQGLKGETGPAGPMGPAGPAGAVGPMGPKGADGVTPNIKIGTVSSLEPGQTPTVTNTGTLGAPVFNFGIPKGQKGSDATVTIDDNLTSSATNHALSANQGKVLKGLIDALSAKLTFEDLTPDESMTVS